MLEIGTRDSDRITTIISTTWDDYIALDLPSKRISFRNGVITIVSPGLNHERYADFIRMIILAYCRQQRITPYTFNSYTLKHEGKEARKAKQFVAEVPSVKETVSRSRCGEAQAGACRHSLWEWRVRRANCWRGSPA